MRKSLAIFLLVGLGAISGWSTQKSDTTPEDKDLSAITKLENDQIKADLAGDISYYETNLAEDWVHGTGSGTWFTKESFLKSLKDTPPMTKSEISNLKIHLYQCAAIATYDQVYEAPIQGKSQQRKTINTDVFVKRQNRWLMVVSHTSTVR